MSVRSSPSPLLRAAAGGAALAFCLFLAWSVPYSSTDDLQWGLEEGLRWWREGLLNSRYAGNLLAVLMCRSRWVKTLVMGGTMFALPLAMARLAARGDRGLGAALFPACFAGILLMPDGMWQETYCWVSGFGNYVVSALLFLAWLLALRRVSRRGTLPWLWAGLLLPMTLALGLFVENLTALVLGGCLVLAAWALFRPALRPPFWACLAGALLALALLLGNGLYGRLAGTGSALNGLRSLSFSWADGPGGVVRGLCGQYFGRLLPIAFLRGIHMGLPMTVISARALWDSPLRRVWALGLLPLAVNLLIFCSGALSAPLRAAGCLAWLCPLAGLLLQKEGRERKVRRVLLYLAAPLSLAPMAAVTTLGQRLYFLPMVLLVVLAADLAAPLLTRRSGAGLAAALAVCLALFWGSRHWTVLACTNLREELTAQAVRTGSPTLVLPADRYERVVWYSRNPWNAEFADYYRRFYRIPDGTTLIFLSPGSFERWPDITPQDWAQRLELAPSKDYTPSLP